MCLRVHMYTKESTRQTGIWWSCVQAKAIQCKGSLKTSLTLDSPEIGTPHNHDPNQANMEVAKANVNLKQLARVTSETPAHLVAQTLTNLSEDARILLPREDSLKRTIRRVHAEKCPPVSES